MDDIRDLPRWQVAIARTLFDENFYLRQYKDVRLAQTEPFNHFLEYGAREGRNPNAHINMRRYLDAHPEIAHGRGHPFMHYLTFGILEHGKVVEELPENDRALRSSVSPAMRLMPSNDNSGYIGVAQLQMILANELGQRAKAALALSHTHYATVTGGTENVITAEASALFEDGWCYIHVCPLVNAPGFFEEESILGQPLILTINGRSRGNVHSAVLSSVMEEIRDRLSTSIRLIVHHLMGFELGSVLSIARACNSRPAIVWVHDFFTLCVDPFLMRNDVQFCAAPDVNSTSCSICSKGHARRSHVHRIRRFFQALQPHVLAPSAAALNIWEKHNNYDISAATVVSLAMVVLGEPLLTNAIGERPMRIAYLGPPLWLKGWLTFRKLADLLRDDSRYQFYRFGHGDGDHPDVIEVDVRVTSADPSAMIRAVAQHEVDVVINWSACYESFSYVTCEALAAGATVVTRKNAGNVPKLVEAVDPSRGVVMRTEIELLAFFLSGKALDLKGKRLSTGRVRRTPTIPSKLLPDEIT